MYPVLSKVIKPVVITPRVPPAALKVPAKVALPVVASIEKVASPSLAPTMPPACQTIPEPLTTSPVSASQTISPDLKAPT